MTAATTPVGGPAGARAVASDGALAFLVAGAGFAAAAIPVMVAICLAESAGDCFAESSAGDYGVAQINYPAHPELFHSLNGPQGWAFPDQNLKMALEVYNQAGSFKPWVTYQTGAYSSFLSRGQKAAGAPSQHDADLILADVGAQITAGALVHTAQGLPNPPSNISPLVRILMVGLGAGLLFIGLNRLAKPVTAPIVATAKSAAKAGAVLAA